MTKCNKKTETYSRIVGYFRPVQNWNAGKQQEFSDRVPYAEQDCTPVSEEPKVEAPVLETPVIN